MIKGLIFDLDGVIVDTAHYHFLSWKKISNDLNIKFNKQDNEKLKGLNRNDSLQHILKLANRSLKKHEIHEILQEKNNIFLSSIESLSKKDILSGVQKIFTDAKKSKILLAIGSSSRNAKFVIEKLKLTKMFCTIVDATMVIKTKPDPEIFLKAANKMKLRPYECIVFEDGESGVIAAKRGGFNSVAVGNKDIKKYRGIFKE